MLMNQNKKQVLVIHGGDFFDTREEYAQSLKKEALEKSDLFPDAVPGWKDTLQKDLGSKFEVLRPTMPSKEDAKYDEWKIWFEKVIPFLSSGCALVGHSLGGIFLARYLSENKLPFAPSGLVLVAAPYFEAKKGKGVADSNAGFTVGKGLKDLASSGLKTTIIHSDDDPIVESSHALKYKKALPEAELLMLKGKGHFFRGQKYPEILRAIKQLFDK